jgi:hypothetical protein
LILPKGYTITDLNYTVILSNGLGYYPVFVGKQETNDKFTKKLQNNFSQKFNLVTSYRHEAALKVNCTPRNKENHEHKVLIFVVSFFCFAIFV